MSWYLSMSIGVTVYAKNEVISFEKLLGAAAALYKLKNAGPNQMIVWHKMEI